jgi:uncharacterized protein YdeI (YjbR/CyaY-like superfamily)
MCPAAPPSGPPADPLQPASVREWESWLERHHADTREAWLKLGRKGCPVASISHAQALESAICFGWIDAQVRRCDEHFTLRRFVPRRAGSTWSQINTAHALRLIEDGRMRPAGLAEVERAQADGRWEAAYAPPSTIAVPTDLRTALDAHPVAAAFFDTLTGSDRYAYLYRLHHVTDPARRTARIADYVERLARGETL